MNVTSGDLKNCVVPSDMVAATRAIVAPTNEDTEDQDGYGTPQEDNQEN